MNAVLRDPRLGIVWLAARLWVGWQFLNAGWEKSFTSESSSWWGSTSGVHGYLSNAGSAASTAGAHASVSHWYAAVINHGFLHADRFFAVAIPAGELLVGIGLIVGFLTTISAFFACVMSLSYLLAGSTSAGVNPLIFGLGLLIMFAGPAAYVYGLDRITMPWLKASFGKLQRPAAQSRPVPIAH